MNYFKGMIMTAFLILLIGLAGCGTLAPRIPGEALKDLPIIVIPPEPSLQTKTLYDARTGKPAGLFFPGDDAFILKKYGVDLREAAQLGVANTQAANKIFEILRTPQKRWWVFWK